MSLTSVYFLHWAISIQPRPLLLAPFLLLQFHLLYPDSIYTLDCSSYFTHHSFATFHSALLHHWNYSEQSCQAPVSAPITTARLEMLLSMNYTDVFKKGFILQWDGDSCSKCRRSEGQWGSYYNEFVYYTIDHIHQKICDDAKQSRVSRSIENLLHIPCKYDCWYMCTAWSILTSLIKLFLWIDFNCWTC